VYLQVADGAGEPNAPAGEVHYFDAVLLEEGSTAGYYFDGTFAPQYRWLSAPDASVSTSAPISPGTAVATFIQYNTEALATSYTTATPTIQKWSGATYLRADISNTPAQNSTKFQPTVPGVYAISATAGFAPNATGGRSCYIAKNGTMVDGSQVTLLANGGTGITGTIVPSATVFVAMNGTTDYVEVYGRQDSGGTLTASNNSGRSSMNATYAGPL
jgi:hypothetical protein